MRDPQTKTIGGRSFKVGMLTARAGVRLYLDLTKMLAPALASAAGKLKLDLSKGIKAGLKSLLDEQDVGPIVEALFSVLADKIDTPQIMAMIDQLAEVSLIDNKPLGKSMDIELGGQPVLLLQWFVFALQANVGDFSGVLGHLAATGAAAVASVSTPSSPST